MDRSRIETVIKQAYAARDAGDVERLMEIFHLDASFGLAGDRAVLPVAGAVQGHPELRTTLMGLVQTFEFVEREILSMVIEGPRAAVHCRARMRFIPTNTMITTELLDLFKFDNGQIVDLVEFADTALIKHLAAG
jgi:ketosteroid isomerase-like protein